MEKKYTLIILLITLALLGGIVGFAIWRTGNIPDNTALAQCLKDKGVKFYGAWRCPHCAATKALFGKGVPALPYVECSTPDGNGTLPICVEKGIKSFPTWIFPDGSRLTGEMSLEALANKASCPFNGNTPSGNTNTQPVASSSSSVAR